MIICQTCGTQAPDTAQYCDECGTKLGYNRDNGDEATAVRPKAPEVPTFRVANVTSVGVPPLVEEKQADMNIPATGEISSKQGARATVVVERGESTGAEFSISSDEAYIGRWDADNGVFPDVDLDAHDADAKVSRRHARILFRNNTYMLEDLGSTNGTFINRGRRLIPGSPHPLQDGDEIIVGKTFLRFKINS
jgi:FHA domain/zinc-ribbon domain